MVKHFSSEASPNKPIENIKIKSEKTQKGGRGREALRALRTKAFEKRATYLGTEVRISFTWK